MATQKVSFVTVANQFLLHVTLRWTRYQLLVLQFVPCIHCVTEAIKKILASYKVKVAQTLTDIAHIFFKPKDPVPREQPTDSYALQDYEHVYLSQTKRQFHMHLTENQATLFLC